MPITANCPNCGHTVKAPDNAAGKKGKCPRCAGIVPIPDVPEILDDDPDDDFQAPRSGFAPAASGYPAPSFDTSASQSAVKATTPVPPGVIGMIVGKPATAWGYRSSFGRTTLAYSSDRLIETTRRPIEERDCEVFLNGIDSVEMTAKGNPGYIALAVMTLGLFSVHILLLLIPIAAVVLFFLLKHRFLIIRSNANVMVVGVKGNDQPYRDFMTNLLAEVDRAKFGR